jgi:hypothetical protein
MEQYKTENILVNVQAINAAPVADGAYKKGQIVSWKAADNQFVPYVATLTPDGIITADTDTASSGNFASVAKGEFSRAGVAAVMAALTPPITVNAALIGACFKNGIILN